jgi:hypothetical protein
MDSLALRTRSASELADAAINLFRANGRLMLVISATMTLPLIVIYVLFMPHSTAPGTGAMIVRVVLIAIGSLWGGITSGALAFAASERYLGREVTANGAISAALGRSLPLGLGILARWLLVGAGLALLIVPGVYAFIFSFGMTAAIMLERRGVNAAWLRSRELARGMKGHVLSALFIAYLVFFVVFVTVGYMVGGMLFGENERALQVMQNTVSIFVAPFVVCTETLLFYDLRIRKEGFDIEHMAAQLT